MSKNEVSNIDINKVIQKLLEKFDLKDVELNNILAFIKPLHLLKGEAFVQKVKRTNKLAILVNGLLYAAFENTKDGKEIVSRFFYLPQNMVVTNFESFSKGVPSNESIIAIEDSYHLILTKENLERLYTEVPLMNLIAREIAENSYILALQRIHELQTLSVNERIENFFGKGNDLFNRVGKQQLTSYLGIRRNALSEYLKNRKL
jgi:CRP/FNR family transcriptional regulator, anaerobic regulatory protein